MGASDVPDLVKHTTLAIWKHGGLSGQGAQERFVSAWNIARSRLVEYGYLQAGSEVEGIPKIKLTPKGVIRESLHRREPGGGLKSLAFDKMYSYLEMATDETKREVSDRDVADDLRKVDLAKKKVKAKPKAKVKKK